jgi:hypothetical protein
VQLGKKKIYPQSIGKWFVPSRFSTEQQDLFHTNFEVNKKPEGEKVLVNDFIRVKRCNYIHASNTPFFFRIVFSSSDKI